MSIKNTFTSHIWSISRTHQGKDVLEYWKFCWVKILYLNGLQNVVENICTKSYKENINYNNLYYRMCRFRHQYSNNKWQKYDIKILKINMNNKKCEGKTFTHPLITYKIKWLWDTIFSLF